MDLIDRIEAALLTAPPAGLNREYICGFFERLGPALRDEVAEIVAGRESAGRPVPATARPTRFQWPADTTTVGARARDNIAAMEVLVARGKKPLTDAERLIVARYSGWGGLKLSQYLSLFPADFPVPEARGLLHEYYTPTRVWSAVARALEPHQADIPVDDDGVLHALEPSAGIGRALRAFERWDARWTALEASAVSVRLLRALFPAAEVVEGFAERWAASNLQRQFGLLLCNPPYGARGEATELDPDGWRTKQAYVYFLVRFAERLARTGVGVWIVPTGFLSSRTSPFERAREAFLKRVHLDAAFRMPSEPVEGGSYEEVVYPSLPVDILFVRGRGGVAKEVPAEDRGVLEGAYFELLPAHILGQVVGSEGYDDTAPATLPNGALVRRGFQVVGRFTAFPGFERRPFDPDVELEQKGRGKKPTKPRGGLVRQMPGELAADQPLRLRTAVALGGRVDAFLALVAAQDPKAFMVQPELVADLRAWQTSFGDPSNDAGLRGLADQANTGAQRFLAAWRSGQLLPVFTTRVRVEGAYLGMPDLSSYAAWLFRRRGGLPLNLTDLVERYLADVPGARQPGDIRQTLMDGGWCFDGENWDLVEPATHYYTGFLWPKYDRAIVDPSRPGAKTQARLLREAIGWTSATKIIKDSAPNQPWIPLDILVEWARLPMKFAYDAEDDQRGVPVGASWPDGDAFERRDGILTIAGYPYGTLNNTDKGRFPSYFERQALSFLGWVNGDKMMFTVEIIKERNELNEEVQVPPDLIRRAMEKHWVAGWHAWLRDRDDIVNRLEELYNRTLRGYVSPDYSSEEIEAARWGPGITLHPYQNEAGRKLLANGCGLLAFDVGLGKTYTAIKLVAAMRQEGKARRPVVLVPNTIIWKWARDFKRCLPDFRVVVIGSNRREIEVTIERGGKQEVVRRFVARNDDPRERGQKWTDFQAGMYDVALVTYSAFSRQQIDADFVGRYVAGTVAVRRAITLALDQEDEKAEQEAAAGPRRAGADGDEKKKKKTRKRTERREADIQERARAWVGEMLSPPKSWKYDEGIDWHQLGVDLLIVDEAQNFKNLFYSSREGSGDRQAAKRAWALDFRCASVREKSGGGGVVLLSATPMKNAATEFYNLLHLVNPAIWEQVGVADPESFINMFAEIEVKKQTLGTGQVGERAVVTAFHHVDALKSVVFRWATFKTAQQVGLKLPKVTRTQHLVAPTEAQRDTFADLYLELAGIEEKLKKVAAGAQRSAKMRGALEMLKNKKQGVMARLYLCALHPGLVGGSTDPMAGPKLVECAETVLKTRPAVCDVGVAPEERWITRPTFCDDNGNGVDDACVTTASAWCLTCGHIVFAENLEVHYWLRSLLIARGINPERIAILNAKEADDLELRQQIAEQFNGRGRPDGEDYEPPRYDVVIANAVAYEGIDLQTRTCEIHHLDVPWEAATLQQRNGRGVRQGNRYPEVGVHFYFVRGSNETQRLERIERKRGIMLSLYEEGDLATNTVVADELSESTDEGLAEAYLAFAPPALAAKIRAAQAEEREREEAERREKARLRANETLGDYIATMRRSIVARERGQTVNATSAQAEAAGLLKELRKFPDDLWTFNWQHAATEASIALEEARDVGSLTTGPALVSGARWRVRVIDREGTGDQWFATEVTTVDDGGPILRLAGRLTLWELRSYIGRYQFADWKPGWMPEDERQEESLRAQLTAGDSVGGPRTLLDVEGREWRRLGDTVTSAAWRFAWPRTVGRSFPINRKVGEMPVPMVGGTGLGFWGEEDFATLDNRVLPRTWDGWRRFWSVVRAERRLKYTQLAKIALFWWGRELPTGIVGADHKRSDDGGEEEGGEE